MSAQLDGRRFPTSLHLIDTIEFGDDLLVGIRLQNFNWYSITSKRTCLVDRDDVRMVDRRGQLRLPQEAVTERLVLGEALQPAA
jgi:hypothetical protein